MAVILLCLWGYSLLKAGEATNESTLPTITAAEAGYSITHWTVEDGLPLQTVTSLAQTPDGYLWCGTTVGLARFDGNYFRIFSGREVPALDRVEILELLSDSQGRLWIGGLGGEIVVYEAGRFRRLGERDGIPLVAKPKFGEDPQGDFWVNARTEGKFYRYQDGHFEVVTWPGPLPEFDRFRANRDGLTWAVCDQERTLENFTANGPEAYVLTAPSGTAENTLGRFFDLQDGRLAVNSKYGIYALEKAGWTLIHTFKEPLAGAVLDGIEDWFGNFWISVFGRGLVFSSREGLTAEVQLPEASQLAFHRALLLDLEGNLWVAGEDGLYRIRRNAFRPQPVRTEPQPVYSATGVIEDSNRRIWLLNEDGWSRQTDDGWETVEHGYPDLRLWTGAAGPDGSVFLGYWYPANVTLQRFVEQVTAAGERRRLGIFPSNVELILQTRAGELWVVAGSLWRWQTNRFVEVRLDTESHFSNVVGLAEDRAGRLYVAESRKGLFQSKADGWQRLTRPNDRGSDRIVGLNFDPEGVLWLGTSLGIARWKDGKWFAFPDLSPTIGTIVRAVMSDHDGYLWISSNQGVVRMARKGLNDFADGKLTDLVSERFGRADGLPSLKGIQRQSTLLQATDGRIWVVMDKGAAVMDVREWKNYRQRMTPPPVHIEVVLIDDRLQGGETFTSPASRSELLVPPGKRRVEIRYAAINLTTGKNHYRYRVEGLGDQWVDAGEQRTTVLQWLPPGHYRFQVTAENQYGIRNEQGASVAFYVQPHWWQTPWFYWGFGVLVAGLLWLARLLKIRQFRREQNRREEFTRQLIQSQEAERKRIAGELHDSLGQNLLVIKSGVTMALRHLDDPKKLRTRLEELAEISTGAVKEVREISHALRPMQLDELGLTKAITGLLRKVDEAGEFRIRSRIESIDGLLLPEFEIDFFRVIQECLSNIQRHADAASVEFSVGPVNEGGIQMTVADDGRGFDPLAAQEANRGMGLRSIQERVRAMGGRVAFHARAGGGTRIEFSIPGRKPTSR